MGEAAVKTAGAADDVGAGTLVFLLYPADGAFDFIEGIATIIPFHLAMLGGPEFAAGDVTSGFLEGRSLDADQSAIR